MSVALPGGRDAFPGLDSTELTTGVSEEARLVRERLDEVSLARRIPFFYRVWPERTSNASDIAEPFRELAERWRAETGDSSSIMHIVMHPAYQRIIGMGQAVVPLILGDLARTESHWFWALQSITGENPVPWEARGYVDRMARAWLDWGRSRGLVT
ncbi:MAG TPA: hypothetical protein VF584_00980 [Longimicrobium sp.]|jgi:hypothetical protein